MMARSIAKVNAQSIGGYFGEGTSCFFIRGTVLSDTAVNGEYPTLNFMRPGNVIEIDWFDGSWASVTITTRSGNRPGDGVTARLYLRDDDLKGLGVDCARIVAEKGLPFAFAVEALTRGLFAEYVEPPEPEPPAPPPPEPAAPALEPEPLPVAEPQPVAAEPGDEPAPPPPVLTPAPVASAAEPEPAEAPESFNIAALMELLRSGRSEAGRNPLVQIGASVAAVAVPMLVYMVLEFMKNKGSGAAEADTDPEAGADAG